MLTGVPEERLGIDAVSHGAQDYLVKDEVTPEVLMQAIRYAIERKKTEETLRQQAEELRILNQLTRHDIRNEMTLVVGRARELSEHVDHHGESQLEEIVRTSNQILQLTRGIGDIVSSVTGSEAADLADVSLQSVLESEIESARQLYGGIVVDVDGEIPPVEVRANDLLSSVFANLLSNAILYNDKETPEVTVPSRPTRAASSSPSPTTARVSPTDGRRQCSARASRGPRAAGPGSASTSSNNSSHSTAATSGSRTTTPRGRYSTSNSNGSSDDERTGRLPDRFTRAIIKPPQRLLPCMNARARRTTGWTA
ncbi:hypothetical protein SAMN04487948_12324 [Halogranum amylolyticum]|uniref:His Kinase A (Phospho-acceptor) domain-containing protein n=1 Tax=Halogranum amylolyticum TaxID=660520 RepID=A0A1H8W4L2_9EURY|nr:hypothetical protein SAMN04487948_12324 [Halogranum amylolyticum]